MTKPSKTFFWGTSTSAHQVEGNNTKNDWWRWEQEGKLLEPSGIACDHYNRYAADFEMISSLGHNAHRFSLEWSRFEPEENVWNEEAFQHYEKVFQELKKRSIEPFVTLHHFTSPEWFAEKGGWAHPETAHYFARFTERVVKAFAPYVKYWITINEPLIYLYHGFYAGLWPPGVKSFEISKKVVRNQLLAHIEAYRVIHKIYAERNEPVCVSIAAHLSHITPCRPNCWRDKFAACVRNKILNNLFVKALKTGILFFPGLFCELLPAKETLDFIGLNYYTRDFVRFRGWLGMDAVGSVCSKDEHGHQAQVAERNMMGWEINPEGLYGVLKLLKRYNLPIYITENGTCTLDDTQRERFIRTHLDAVVRARKEGVPVDGYFYWSLMDNFEWAFGFGPRFGVVEVDYPTQTRKIRPSAYVLSELCRKIESPA